ncbi:MAG: hypothetical protein HYU66_01895 [Armatimonadetes bacterium]|nr:hypothetical protein [Armatimonadota bacterium]
MRFLLPCLLVAVPHVLAAEYVAPLTPQPPALDGRIDATEWAAAVGFDGFAWEGRLERRRVRAWVTAAPDTIYVAIRSQLPAEGALVAAIDKDIEKLVFDDSVEVWLAMHARGNAKQDPGWDGGWRVASTQHDGWWDWECALPLAAVAPGRRSTDGAWGINLCRNWKQDWAFSSLGGGGYAPGKEVLFRFVPGAPAIQHTQRRDPAGTDVMSVVAIAGPARVQVVQRLQRDKMPDVLVDEHHDIAAGKPFEVPLTVDDQNTSGTFTLSLEVTSEDGQTVYYRRQVGWRAGPRDWTWKTAKPVKLPVDLQIAYYPYAAKLRVLADVSGLPPEAKLQHLLVTVRPKGKAAALKSLTLNQFDPNGRQAAELALPGLDGEYEVVAKAVGANVPAGEVVKPLTRTKFEWEHNPAGRKPAVYAPFTPLKLTGKTLDAVLRRHELNGLGLWDQVTAAAQNTGVSKPLLAAPMRIRATTANGDQTVQPAALGVVQPGEARMVLSGGFRAGPLRAATRTTWDLDGLAWTELTLQPTGGQTVQALTLEIPFRNDAATLMHAMNEGIRHVIYSQAVPAGEGVVWDAGKLPPGELPKGFCTYCFVGNPNRGIAWFAENDKGWSWDAGKPNLELVREGATLTLRVHLISKPLAIDQPRTLRFGLQAAPAKPRLAPWRYRFYRDNYSLLGTDINWFALGDCGSVYPAHKDLYLWEMLARGNKEKLSDQDVEKVVGYGLKYWEPYGPDRVNAYKAHVRYNLRSRYGAKMVFYYNRASFQLADEFQTFEDEWALSDYRTVGPGNGIGEVKIVPCESYDDHALYWYGKSFDVGGNQGVYWDNWFICPTQNTTMTDAYRTPDGSVVPAAGILGMRELCRRTFNYMNERKMTPITFPHMTSTNILPMHGFATVQYDWEWKYSEGDVQNRFPREYLLLVSNGDLAGTWPVLLGDHGPQAEDPWTQRTFAAVSIVHELNPSTAGWQKCYALSWKPFIEPIIALLDDPALVVYRYWDERPQPVTANDPDLPTIVYSVLGKEAVAAVVSYAGEDRDVTLTIDPAALGFKAGYTVTDVETGEAVAVAGDRVQFRMKKHDLKELRLSAG